MSEVTIDQLQIEISSDSADAIKSIKKLEKTLNKLKSTVSGGLGLKSFAQEFKDLSTASSSIDNNSSNKLEKLLQSLEKLKSASGVKISTNIANPILEIAKAIKSVDNNTYTKLGRFSESLKKIGVIKGSISANYGNQIERIGNALKLIDSNSIYKLDALAVSLKGFSSIGKSNLSGLITNLSKLPSVYEGFKDIDVKAFAEDMRLLSDALIPLASNIDKIGRGFSNLPTKVRSLVNISPKLVASNKSVSRSFDNMLGKIKKSIQAVVFSYEAFKMLGRTLGYFVEKSTSYVENLNLFHASMGRFGKEAEEYADIVNKALGIDKSEWIRNQGIFMTLATGFGVVEERAYRMSRNLTQLGYDLSSFFNISFADSMQKLTSGISGELEPLRRLGYDLSQARLKAVALSLGIKKSFNDMTQAEKAQLRYHAIMTQVTASHGDLARTLNTPANQLRIMKTLFQQAGRAIGDIFIPALNSILPVAIAVLKVVRELADHIAHIFGFQLPKIDYSGIEHSSGAVDGLTDSLDNATKSAKALKSATLGFDELNVISPSPSSGGNGGVGGASGGWKDFPLENYDFFKKSKIKDHLKDINPLVETLKDNMALILSSVKAIGTAFITWKSIKFAESLASKILGDIDKSKWNQVAIGLTVTVASMTFLSEDVKDIAKNGLNLSNLLQTALSGAGATWGIATTLGAFVGKALAWKIAIPVVIAFGAFKFFDSWNKEQIKKDLEKRFGEISLTESEAQELSKNIMKSDLTLELDLFVDQQKARNQIEGQLKESVEKIEKLKVKMQFDLNYDKDTLLSTTQGLLTNASSYLEERQLEMLIAFKGVFKDSKLGLDLSGELNTIFADQQQSLTDLGNKLKQTISEGFVNGEWIGNKKQEAIKLMSEIEQIQNEFKEQKARFRLEYFMELERAGGLDEASSKFVHEQVQLETENLLKITHDKRITARMGVDLIFDKYHIPANFRKDIYDIINASANSDVMEIQMKKIRFQTNFIESQYKEDVTSLKNNLKTITAESMKEVYEGYIPNADTLSNISEGYQRFIGLYEGEIKNALDDSEINGITKKSMAEMFKLLNVKSYPDEVNEIIAKSMEMGIQIPTEVSRGLKDRAALGLIAGDMDSIHFLVGNKMSTDPSFLGMLATVEGHAQNIPLAVKSGIASNIHFATEGGELIVTSLDTGVKHNLGVITEPMKQNFLDLGIDITTSLHKGADEMMDKVDFKGTMEKVKTTSNSVLDFKSFLNIGENIVNGLFNGISNLLKKNDYGKNIFEKVTNTVKKVYAIHSPSKVFEEIGEYVGEGLYLGMDNKIEKVKGVYNNVPDSFKNGFQIQMADIFKNIATAIFESMKVGFTQIQELFLKLPEWMGTNVASKMNSIFDNMIGNLNKSVNSASSMIGSLQSQANSFQNRTPSRTEPVYFTKKRSEWKLGEIISRTQYGTVRYLGAKLRAKGGLPPVGEIFIARESGPEMVGKMGNSSAVANNEQIVDGIRQGVYEAVTEAMKNSSRGQDGGATHVYIDGEDVAKRVRKEDKGYPVMGGGAFGY